MSKEKVQQVFTGLARNKGESYEDYKIRRKGEHRQLKNRRKNNFAHMSKYVHKETEQERDERVIKETEAILIAKKNGKLTHEESQEKLKKIYKLQKIYHYGVGTRKGSFKDVKK